MSFSEGRWELWDSKGKAGSLAWKWVRIKGGRETGVSATEESGRCPFLTTMQWLSCRQTLYTPLLTRINCLFLWALPSRLTVLSDSESWLFPLAYVTCLIPSTEEQEDGASGPCWRRSIQQRIHPKWEQKFKCWIAKIPVRVWYTQKTNRPLPLWNEKSYHFLAATRKSTAWLITRF